MKRVGLTHCYGQLKQTQMQDGSRTNPNRVYETVPGEYYISDATLELDTRVPNFYALLHLYLPRELCLRFMSGLNHRKVYLIKPFSWYMGILTWKTSIFCM